MSSLMRKFLYWLGAGMAFSLFLFFLIPKPRDNPYMKIYSSLNGSDFLGCEFSSEERSGVRFRFDITPEECRFIIYQGGAGVRFYIDYPSLKVVRAGGEKEFPVLFYMERVSMDEFDADRHLAGKKPISVRDGIEVYEFSGSEERKFAGKDGVPVYASDYIETIRASRLYKSGLLVFYQYPKELTDIRAMDDFALDVLRKRVVE
ncbi:hypothetical protein [Pseudomonas sp. ACM7]|uniref:hypothetical protein n=1 Tax=Pseudomonas sp. ACM7 TaxID=2052956 RepID=UPI001011BE00|nr:hypothetical protein [Pseudomonas sp. ACM7]QAY88986.1 hypothetical protein CUN63_03060 [Pseudomonas sp. ACM7]